jgi:hypothetical protein
MTTAAKLVVRVAVPRLTALKQLKTRSCISIERMVPASS